MENNKVNKNKKVKEMDVVFLLDRSGSMYGSESDTINGYNSYLNKQRKNKYKTNITTILFDNEYEILHEREDINKVNDLTEKEYYVRGCTALLDAIGITITKLDKQVKDNKVLFIITTDGLENASSEYNKSKIKKLIEDHSNWEFLYIGANIDSYSEGESIGIKRNNISNYSKTTSGTKEMFNAISLASDNLYECSSVGSSWKKELEKEQ